MKMLEEAIPVLAVEKKNWYVLVTKPKYEKKGVRLILWGLGEEIV